MKMFGGNELAVDVDKIAAMVLRNVLGGILKQNDSPVSSQTHFDAAIVGLLSLTSWRPDSDEARDIVDQSESLIAMLRKQRAGH